ncbi:MAG: restriction endonuclease [Proteobacteria bacterium]|nr:restriction endonuclease [Pseudomonadota bacterium]
MKWKMHDNSLFAVLLRSAWWISALIALGVFAVVRLIMPDHYAAFATLPFVVIAAVGAWKQISAPSSEKIAASIESVREMTWEGFSGVLEEGLRRDGYSVARTGGAQADFEITKAGRVSLVACKRWKAARTGIEPLRELQAAAEAREAAESLYVLTGEISDTARAFATEKKIRLIHGAELVKLLP